MKAVACMALTDGMILAKDIYSFQKKIIAKENDVVNRELVAKLSRYSIMCVDIKEEQDFTKTSFERIRQSEDFRNFEKVYHYNLNSCKFMLQSFLNDHTPINVSYLLQLHDNVLNCCKPEELLEMLFHLLPDKDDFTYAHFFNAALVSTVFGRLLGLCEAELQILTLCGFFYDIGRLKLPEELLHKTSALTKEEAALMKTHTTLGYELLKKQNLNPIIKNCTLTHHMYADGSGYPGSTAEVSPDSFAGYISIIDTYEAIRMADASRSGLTPFQIIKVYKKQGFEKYDSHALKVFLDGLISG